jgi:hypothetical protein
VTEYFLFDPTQDYLNPPLQGFRLVDGDYVPVDPIDGRLPSEILGLHFECVGTKLRFYNPTTGEYRMTRLEARAAAENSLEAAEAERRCLAEENDRLRSEIERLRRR